MDGNVLKKIAMQKTGLSFTQIAKAMGLTTQATHTIFKSPDVKTGHLEHLIKSLGLKMNDFYPELCISAEAKKEMPEGIDEFQKTLNDAVENSPLVKYLQKRNDELVLMLMGQKPQEKNAIAQEVK